MTSKVSDAADAARLIRDGQSVASVGVIGWITPDAVLRAIGERFDATGSPRDLTFFFPCGTGDSIDIRGMDHVAREGLMRRIVSGSYINPLNPSTGERPALMKLIQEDRVAAYSWPIGATMHWLREVARRSPGYLTKVGLGTYIDPRQGGGRLTTLAEQQLVEVVDFREDEYLFYPSWSLDVGIIRASSADELGNLSYEDEPLISSALALAMAVKACGGKVIAQVRRLVPRQSRPALSVRVPSPLVDMVVVDEQQMMGTGVPFDTAYLGGASNDMGDLPRLPPGPDKVIARRIARELRPGDVAIFGFGASSDVALVMAEDGLLRDGEGLDYVFTTEHGPFGGIVMSGWQFSANVGPEALVDGVSQFDFIDGGNCDFGALSFAQLDSAGNVNVSRFGKASPGAGGFIDIAANTRRLVFGGTFTTAGLRVEIVDGRLSVVEEGKVTKFVPTVQEITYRAGRGVAEREQSALVVTERAVFELTPAGLVLTEVAPGVDVRRDVLDRMEFAPVAIVDPLPEMHVSLFEDSVTEAASSHLREGGRE